MILRSYWRYVEIFIGSIFKGRAVVAAQVFEWDPRTVYEKGIVRCGIIYTLQVVGRSGDRKTKMRRI